MCLVFVMLSRVFIVALWSPVGKADLLAHVCHIDIIVILLQMWERCGTWLYRFLILAVFLILIIPHNKK